MEQVLKKTAPRAAWLRRSSFVVGGVLSAAAALVLVRNANLQSAGFHAKGSQMVGPHVSIVCKDGPTTACPHGSKLLFLAGGSTGPQFLNAYAENTATGERVWFSPSEQGQPATVTIAVQDAMLDLGVPLASLPAGTYRVHVSLSPQRLSRAVVLGSGPALVSGSEALLTVLP